MLSSFEYYLPNSCKKSSCNKAHRLFISISTHHINSPEALMPAVISILTIISNFTVLHVQR